MTQTALAQDDIPPRPLHYSDRHLRGILSSVRTIAMVGASGNWKRPSYFAMKYLQKKGYRVIPVNPGRAGDSILGETVHPDLASVPGPFEMVDVFRSSEDAAAVTDEVLRLHRDKGIRVLWMQLGVRNDAAAARAEAAGLTVVMDRCPKIEYGRLSGELTWCGVNSGLITSKPLKAPR